MIEGKTGRQINRNDGPAETIKKLPEAFPEKFDTDEEETSNDKKRGKGARFHGSM